MTNTATTIFTVTDPANDTLSLEQIDGTIPTLRATVTDDMTTALEAMLNRADVLDLYNALRGWLGKGEEEQAKAKKLAAERDKLAKEARELREELHHTKGQLETAQQDRDEAAASLEEFVGMGSTLEMRQRLTALTAARDAALTVKGQGGMFTGKGETVTQPAVLSLAHFVMTGERDYVTSEGQYIERQAAVTHPGTLALDPTPADYAERTFGPAEDGNDD